MARELNKAGLDLIKHFESFSAKPYWDAPGETWTIGYGHTQGITAHTPPISLEEGEILLKQDVQVAARAVERFIKVPLSDNQHAALTSLVYNTGPLPLQSTLGHLLNAGSYIDASEQFGRWVYAGYRILPGLVRRREAERALFLTADI